MHKTRHSPTSSKNGIDYEFVGGSSLNGNTVDDLSTWQGRTMAYLRYFARLPWWKILLPIISTFASIAFFIITVVLSIRWVRGSGILVPAYKEIPVISQAQIQAAMTRHITAAQCLAKYPGLFE